LRDQNAAPLAFEKWVIEANYDTNITNFNFNFYVL